MMKKITASAGFILIFLACWSQRNVRFIMPSAPATSNPDTLFLAGSFNGWNPHDSKYFFQKNADGDYVFETRLSDGMLEFKVTRGNWSKVECKKSGADIANRSLKLS